MRLVVLNMLYSYNNNDNDKDINRPGGLLGFSLHKTVACFLMTRLICQRNSNQPCSFVVLFP